MTPPSSNTVSPEQHIAALNGVFGQHRARASHAKGIAFSGHFAPQAHSLAIPLLQNLLPLIGRFSVGGGNPKAPDNAKTVRGMSFLLANGTDKWEAALISAPHFFARDSNEFVEFLRVRAPQADGKPDAAKLATFSAAHPHTTLQAQYLAQQSVAKSYATENYWSCNTFWVNDQNGKALAVRWRVVAKNGREGYNDEEASAAGTDFLNAELALRLSKGIVEFSLLAQIGGEQDSVTDSTQAWPADRAEICLGTIQIQAIGGAGETHMFIPTVLPTGVTPSADPILLARAHAYPLSLAHRQGT